MRLDLSIDERDSLIQLFISYLDIFAWSYEDMSGLDPSIVQHRLPLLPHAKSVKQKLRQLHPLLEFAGEKGDSKVAQREIFMSDRVSQVVGQCHPYS